MGIIRILPPPPSLLDNTGNQQSSSNSSSSSWVVLIGCSAVQSIVFGVSAAAAYAYLQQQQQQQQQQLYDSSTRSRTNETRRSRGRVFALPNMKLPSFSQASDYVLSKAHELYEQAPLWFWLGLSYWTLLNHHQGQQSSAGASNSRNDNSSSSSSGGASSSPLWQHATRWLVWSTTAALSMVCGYQAIHTGSSNNDNDNNGSNNNSRKPRFLLDPPRNPFAALKKNSTRSDTTSDKQHNVNGKKKSSTNQQQQQQQQQRYLELLVHNVSHTDLILSLDCNEMDPAETNDQSQQSQSPTTPADSDNNDDKDDDANNNNNNNDDDDDSDADPFCFARPRFSCFDLYTQRVLEALTASTPNDIQTMDFARYERSESSPRYSIKEQPTAKPIPVGLVLPRSTSSGDSSSSKLSATAATAAAVQISELSDLRVRGRDQTKLARRLFRTGNSNNRESQQSIAFKHVFFPLLASLLARWKQQIADKEYNKSLSVKRVLILVTGVGTPRNYTHQVTGNSTQKCADLMEYFLNKIDPDLVVVKIHSDAFNIFRYDENLLFCERQLLPTVNAYRDAHAYGWPYPDERGTAAVATPTKDSTFNLDWIKSFALTLSFADGSPARTHAIQASLRGYRPAYFHFWQLKTFWHESKIVDDDIEVHSFEEMETSPAVDASRCTDPMIQAVVQEMKIFRAEMTETLQDDSNDISKFWLRKTHKPVLAVLLVQPAGAKKPRLYRGTNMEVSMPTGSLCAERNVIGSALAENPGLKREDLKLIAVLAVPPVEEESGMKRIGSFISEAGESASELAARKTLSGSEHDAEWVQTNLDASFDMIDPPAEKQQCVECNDPVESTPVRRIHLFSKSTTRKSKRTVVVQSTNDINPLRPCGACNEWLKKIAEPNPYFRILTFTDANCNGIYVTPCQE